MSLFITGSGTGVGKTVVTASLAAVLQKQGIRFCVYKPIQTGSPDGAHPEDLETVRQWVGPQVETVCSYCFADPVAPYVADVGRTIDFRKILMDFKALQKQFDVVLVEGAGGVRVPIAPYFEMLDLIRMFQLPVLVATSPQLGTVNHTLLTVDALLTYRLEVKGVVVSGMPEESEADLAMKTLLPMLEAFLPVPLLGVLPQLACRPEEFTATGTATLAMEAMGLRAPF